jgi:hypothetical protein
MYGQLYDPPVTVASNLSVLMGLSGAAITNATVVTLANHRSLNSLQHAGLVVRRAGSGSYVQLAAPVAGYQFGLLIPELGNTEIFEPICQGIIQSPRAKSHSLICGHTSQKSASKKEAALSLCRQFIEQVQNGFGCRFPAAGSSSTARKSPANRTWRAT